MFQVLLRSVVHRLGGLDVVEAEAVPGLELFAEVHLSAGGGNIQDLGGDGGRMSGEQKKERET
jgi:hypothetical protein